MPPGLGVECRRRAAASATRRCRSASPLAGASTGVRAPAALAVAAGGVRRSPGGRRRHRSREPTIALPAGARRSTLDASMATVRVIGADRDDVRHRGGPHGAGGGRSGSRFPLVVDEVAAAGPRRRCVQAGHRRAAAGDDPARGAAPRPHRIGCASPRAASTSPTSPARSRPTCGAGRFVAARVSGMLRLETGIGDVDVGTGAAHARRPDPAARRSTATCGWSSPRRRPTRGSWRWR